jgi:hypothetical protein
LIAPPPFGGGVFIAGFCHFDRLAEVLDFENRWIAEPKSLDP